MHEPELRRARAGSALLGNARYWVALHDYDPRSFLIFRNPAVGVKAGRLQPYSLYESAMAAWNSENDPLAQDLLDQLLRGIPGVSTLNEDSITDLRENSLRLRDLVLKKSRKATVANSF